MDQHSPPHAFRTKTGTCSLADGRIVLSRTGARGALANSLVGSSVHRILAIYTALALITLYLGTRAIIASQPIFGGILVGMALLLVRGIWRSRGLSAASEIEFASVTSIEPHSPVPPLTRGYFVVHFKVGDKAFRRLIILPGIAEGGVAEFAKATSALRDAGLPLR